MNKILLLPLSIALVFVSVSTADAWKVNIKNSCNNDVQIWVTGEHLFWKQIDCEVFVNKGSTGVCVMPGVICPFDIRGSFYLNGSVYALNEVHCARGYDAVCCCFDVNVEVRQLTADSCQLWLLP